MLYLWCHLGASRLRLCISSCSPVCTYPIIYFVDSWINYVVDGGRCWWNERFGVETHHVATLFYFVTSSGAYYFEYVIIFCVLCVMLHVGLRRLMPGEFIAADDSLLLQRLFAVATEATFSTPNRYAIGPIISWRWFLIFAGCWVQHGFSNLQCFAKLSQNLVRLLSIHRYGLVSGHQQMLKVFDSPMIMAQRLRALVATSTKHGPKLLKAMVCCRI